MEDFRLSSSLDKTSMEKQRADESKFIADHKELTGDSESQARNMYIYSEIILQRDAYSYHLE